MKFLSITLAMSLLSISNAYAANITVKAKQPPVFTEEGIHLKTNKGHIAIYAINLTTKQLKSLETIKKNDCVLITAKDKTLSNNDGVISIGEFMHAKKIACK